MLDCMIHHVQLACPRGSEDASRSFYAGLLGLAEKPKPPILAARGGRWFAGVGIELHLGVEDDVRPARKARPGLLWPDLDALAGRLEAAGVPIERGDAATLPGFRRFHTHDPHGNRLEFLSAIG